MRQVLYTWLLSLSDCRQFGFIGVLLVLSLGFGFQLSAYAEVLRYTDDKGVTHYVDSTDRVPEQYKQQLKDAPPLPEISKVQAPPAYSPDNSRMLEIYKKRSAKKHKGVEIFVTSWCGYCRQLEQFLDKEKIKYTRFDIEKDKEADKEYQALGVSGVPVTRVGEQVISGFKPDEIKKAAKKL